MEGDGIRKYTMLVVILSAPSCSRRLHTRIYDLIIVTDNVIGAVVQW